MIEKKERGRRSSRARRELSPEERTADLFNLDVRPLTTALENRIVALVGSDKQIRLDKVQTYPKYPDIKEEGIGPNYKRGKEGVTIDTIPAGRLWVFHIPVRRMRQALVAANDRGEQGACVRILRASKYDQGTERFVSMPREGDIANFFELEDNEVAILRFMDQSDVLYLERSVRRVLGGEAPQSSIDSSAANQYIQNLLQE